MENNGCSLYRDGALYCWGFSGYDILGPKVTSTLYQPPDYPIDFGDFEVTQFAGYNQHACVASK